MTDPRTTREENVAVARRLVDEILNAGNMATFDAIFHDDYVNHNIPVPGVPGTKDGFRQVVLSTRAAFPDVRVEIQDFVAEGEFVVFRDHVTATSRGAFFGVPPNGKRLDWTEIHFLRIRAGRIVEHWTNFDQVGILMQLGILPATAPSGTDLLVLATARAKPGRERELEQALLDVAEPTRAQPGCVSWSLYQASGSPTTFVAEERWTSNEAHDKHLQGAHVQRLMVAMSDLLAEPPSIEAHKVLA
jgi:steroid delta-isomerase-like uncharacterized protein